MFWKQQDNRLALIVLLLLFAALAACKSPSLQSADVPDSRLERDTFGWKQTKTIEAECLQAHNQWRRLHQASDLVYDKKIATFAQKRADHIAQSRSDGAAFGHANNLPFGENLAWHSNAATSCAEMVKMWYQEVDMYNFGSGRFNSRTGHFTQLVWRGTERVGCATATGLGPRGGVYLVCNYDPPGNMIGDFQDNVLPQGL